MSRYTIVKPNQSSKVGISFKNNEEEGYIQVDTVSDGGLGASSGLRAGDVIEEINGISMENKTSWYAASKVREAKGEVNVVVRSFDEEMPTYAKRSAEKKKKVFIIGAGPSGLVTLKEVLEAGCFDPICVDAKSQIGGLFSASYDELYTTTSNIFMAFSDFPPKESIRYWKKEEYLQYLNDYVEHFQLRKYIKLNTAVKACILDKDTHRWKIVTKSWASQKGEMRRGSIQFSQDKDICTFVPANTKRPSLIFRKNVSPGYTYDADYLFVASGTNQVPMIPAFPNLSPGVEVVHSAEFTNAGEICRGKRVLIVGNGESASDVAAQSTDVAEKVTLWSRRDFSMGFRFVTNFLADSEYDERELLYDQDDYQPGHFLEAIANNRVLSRLPLGIFTTLLNAMLSDVTSWHGEGSPAGITAEIMKRNFRKDKYALDTSPPTKSGGVMAHAIACKDLDVIIAPTMEINGSTATFHDASYIAKKDDKVDTIDLDVDIIILCTGYKLDFSWIGVEDGANLIEPNPRKWFKHCFPPGLAEKLAFLGYARPNQGGIPQCSELLARYAVLLLKGERNLPPNYAELARREGEEEKETFYATPNHNSLVEFPPFVNSIARLIGCEPRIPLFPSRYVKFWTLPMWTCWYRLNGPGANPKACWDIVDQYRIIDTFVPMPLLIIYFLFGILMQPLLFVEFIMQKVLKEPSKDKLLLKGYKHRVGAHFYQMSGNHLRLEDLVNPFSGWLVVEALALLLSYMAVSNILLSSALLFLGFVYMIIRKKQDSSEEQGELNSLQSSTTKSRYGSTTASNLV